MEASRSVKLENLQGPVAPGKLHFLKGVPGGKRGSYMDLFGVVFHSQVAVATTLPSSSKLTLSPSIRTSYLPGISVLPFEHHPASAHSPDVSLLLT
jgi:hypothetical protein